MRLYTQMPELVGATTWLNSKPLTMQMLLGKPTIIHFWSVSCTLCKTVMPTLNHFRQQYDELINVIAVHMPRGNEDLDIQKISAQAEQHAITQPIFIDNELLLSDAFQNRFVPAYYVFDSNGKLRHYQAGEGGIKLLEKRVNRIIRES